MTLQALLGQLLPDHPALWDGLDARRPMLNQQFPVGLDKVLPVRRCRRGNMVISCIMKRHDSRSLDPFSDCSRVSCFGVI